MVLMLCFNSNQINIPNKVAPTAPLRYTLWMYSCKNGTLGISDKGGEIGIVKEIDLHTDRGRFYRARAVNKWPMY